MQGFEPESMAAKLSFTFLGTGTSVGVPVIGCSCEVCRSGDAKNNRLRSSALVQHGETRLLVDSGPDLRTQALRYGIKQIDAVLYTHEHLDHVVGFDELRAFCWKREDPLPMHATEECHQALKKMFSWAFSTGNVYRGYVKPDPKVLDGPFGYGGVEITPLPVHHGAVNTVGYLFGAPGTRKIAYISDVKRIPDETMDLIRGVDVLVIDALRPEEHPTHLTTEEALAVIGEVGPSEAWLTHLGHENDHHKLENATPDGVRVAYDGLLIEL